VLRAILRGQARMSSMDEQRFETLHSLSVAERRALFENGIPRVLQLLFLSLKMDCTGLTGMCRRAATERIGALVESAGDRAGDEGDPQGVRAGSDRAHPAGDCPRGRAGTAVRLTTSHASHTLLAD
jgi:hypothetical protein